MALVIFWTLFAIVGSIRCERGDNCTCGSKNAPECPCDIIKWNDGTKLRKKLDCSNKKLEGDPLFIDLSVLDVLAEELFFESNKGIKSLDPDMFRNQTRRTGMFFDGCNLTSLNASTFENMTRLVKLEFARNKLRHIDAHFVTNSPKLRRIETEDNPIAGPENTCDATYVKHFITYGELLAPLCWKQCPIGRFNSFNFSDECPQCPMGKFNNFSIDPKITMQAVCYDCPQGTYGNESGATSISQCRDCPSGQYSDTPGDTLCDYCAPGRFSEASGVSLCSPCSAGSFSSAGDSQCTICSAGKYSGEEARESCTDCRAGWFSMNASTACSPCRVGSYSQVGQANCTLCPTGSYGPSMGLSSCPLCPAGKKGPDLGAVNASQCLDCLPGHYSAQVGAYCGACVPGKYAPKGSIVCKECDAGKDSLDVAGECSLCRPGFFNPDEGQKCQQCQRGRYNPVFGAINQSQCLICPEGHFCDNLADATPCSAGTYSERVGANSSATCISCATGKYAASGASSCSDCPSSHSTHKMGASQTECVDILQELLEKLPFVIGGSCAFVLAIIFVLWLYCKDRKFVEEERAHKKYLVPISAVFGLFDFVSDFYFAYSLAHVDDRPDFSLELAVTFLIGPFLLSLACLSWLTCREIKKPVFFNWFKDHAAFASMTVVMSATNASFLELTYCELGHLGVFQAPWSKSTRDILQFAGLLTNLLEDIPQLCLQLYVAKLGWSFFVIVSTSFSVLSLVSGSTKHLFLLFGWCKHQRRKHRMRNSMYTSQEPFIFRESIN